MKHAPFPARRWKSVASAGLLVCAVNLALAAPLDVRQAFRAPTLDAVRLAPNGTHAVGLGSQDGWTAVVMIDTATGSSRVFSKPVTGRQAPRAVHWVGPEVLALSFRDGTRFVDLQGKSILWTNDRYFHFLHNNEQGQEIVLVKRAGNKYFYDRLNVRTGNKELANFKIPGEPMQWLFDERGVPRMVTTVSTAFWGDDTTVSHWFRGDEKDTWQRVAEFPYLRVDWMPSFLMNDGHSVAVASTQGRDTRAFVRYDPATRVMGEILAGHPTEDILVVPRSDDDFPLVVTAGLKPQLHWFDARWARLQQAVDQALPDRLNLLTGDPQGTVLVLSAADVEPGRYWLLDSVTMKLRELGATSPQIDPDAMRPKQVLRYPSLDGTLIPAYLTLPAGATRDLPAVVLIHGGPVARDEWLFDPEVQMLAARGYAVLQPQFRGSAGFGKRFMEAGYGQWGLTMQDDVTAAARWLVSQGIADPRRLCIYGASYGGYAAMWAMAKTPELFKCGISLAGVSDLNYMFKDDSDTNDSPIGRLLSRAWVGDPRSQAQQLSEVSPLAHAQDFRAPVLIAHGTADGRVPVEHSRRLVDALKREGKQVQWLPLENEGHGLSDWDSLETFYNALFAFLDKHIGAKPAIAPPKSD